MIKGTRVMVKPWHMIEQTLEEHANTIKGGRISFQGDMKKYCFKKTRIKDVYENDDNCDVYRLEGCSGWWWHKDWLYDMSYHVDWPEGIFDI